MEVHQAKVNLIANLIEIERIKCFKCLRTCHITLMPKQKRLNLKDNESNQR